MPDSPSRSQARLLAPVALVVAAIAVLIVLTSSSTGGSDPSPSAADTQPTTTQRAAKKAPVKKKATTYTVKTGDSLGSIAQKTGVAVERLQEINPDVDSQALVAGQKIKLTE